MQSATRPSDRQIAVVISVIVGFIVAIITILTFFWIYELASGPERRAAAEAVEIDAPYSASTGVLLITQAERNVPDDTRDPWLSLEAWTEGVQAGQAYVEQFPEPQNAQVLTGMTTEQIWGYMQQHVSGALGVGCQYCHDVQADENGTYLFNEDTYAQKLSAREMMRLTNDLNAEFIVDLPNWRGNYVQCATCHNNQPIDMDSVGPTFRPSTPPIKVTVDPLDANGEPILEAAAKPEEIQEPLMLQDAILYYIYNYQVWDPFDPADEQSGRGSLALTYAEGRTQEQVTITQNVMNYMAWSLGENCLYCHNSRNFWSYELEAAGNLTNAESGYNRLKAQQMLLMTTWMTENWLSYGALPKTDIEFEGAGAFVDGQYYRKVDGDVYTVPGCYTCHNGRYIPKKALDQNDIPSGEDGNEVFPEVLRGNK